MERQHQINDLVLRWEDQRDSGREISTEELCRDCPELLPAVNQEIQALQSMQKWLKVLGETDPAGGPTSGHVTCGETLSPEEEPGRTPTAANVAVHIPQYEILELLGKGGMGVVYKARHRQLDRVVALKMILAGEQARPGDLGRFRLEARASAQLDHPNIVQVFEVGEQEGRPFLVLEFCGGGSLHRKLGGTPLPAAESARLVESLARAMDVAHRKRIIHRDLKPGNVLLTATGQPKITDFGLAKLLDQDSGHTHTGEIMGTPSYMAPEQADGRQRELGPATDIYALGAILYECLTGRPPFKAASAIDTALQVVHDEPVPPRRLQSRVPRDLETICLKCLQKEPRKRYASALELAEDLRRFRTNEPIHARPVGLVEWAWRWCRRNPRVAALVMLLILVIGGSVTGLAGMYLLAEDRRAQAEVERNVAQVQTQKAEAAKTRAEIAQEKTEIERKKADTARQKAKTLQQKAEAEAAKARQVSEFLVGMFEASDPMGLKGFSYFFPSGSAELKAKEILDRGARQIKKGLQGQPSVRAAQMDTIGSVYRSLGLYAEAEELLREAYHLRQEAFGPEHEEVAASLYNLGWLYHDKGDFLQARDYYGKSLHMRQRLLGDDSPVVTSTMFNLAWLYGFMGELDESEQMFRAVVKRRQQQHGTDEHRTVGLAKAGLAGVYIEKQQFLQALPLAVEAANTFAKVEGGQKLAHALSLFQTGVINGYLWHDFLAAEQSLREALAITERELGNKHPYVAVILYQIGDALEHQNRLDAAEDYYRKSLDVVRASVGFRHPKATIPVAHLALLLNRRRSPEVIPLFEELLEAQTHQFGPNHPFVGESLLAYSEVLGNRGAFPEQVQALERAAAIFRTSKAKFGMSPVKLPLTLKNLGALYKRTGEPARACTVLLERRQIAGDRPQELFDVAADLASLVTVVRQDTILAKLELAPLNEKCSREACATLQQALDRGFKDPVALHIEPRLAGIRENPKFQQLQKRAGPLDASKCRIFQGTLVRTDPRDRVQKGSHHKVHLVQLKAGGDYRIDLISWDFDAFLRVEDSRGKELTHDDDSGGYLNARLLFHPSANGTYRVIVTTFAGGTTGNYTLSVYEQSSSSQK